MRLPLVLPLLLLAAACGAPAAPPGPAWPAGLDLPVAATVGDLPPGDSTVVVSCTAEGRLTAAGTPVTDISQLVATLAPRVARDPTVIGAESPTHVLLAFDREVPWRTVAWTMQACADPKVMTPRILFLVRHARDGEPGAFAAFLPKDHHHPGPGDDRRPPDIFQVKISANAPGAEPAALAAWLLGRPAGSPPASVTLEPSPTAPLQVVVEAADAAARGGASWLRFLGTPPPAEPGRTDWFKRRTLEPGARWALVVRGLKVPDPLPPLAVPPRVRGRFAGFPDLDAGPADDEMAEDAPPPVSDPAIEDEPPR